MIYPIQPPPTFFNKYRLKCMKYTLIAGDVIGAFCLKSNYEEMNILSEAKSMGSRRGVGIYLPFTRSVGLAIAAPSAPDAAPETIFCS